MSPSPAITHRQPASRRAEKSRGYEPVVSSCLRSFALGSGTVWAQPTWLRLECPRGRPARYHTEGALSGPKHTRDPPSPRAERPGHPAIRRSEPWSLRLRSPGRGAGEQRSRFRGRVRDQVLRRLHGLEGLPGAVVRVPGGPRPPGGDQAKTSGDDPQRSPPCPGTLGSTWKTSWGESARSRGTPTASRSRAAQGTKRRSTPWCVILR